MLNFICGLLEEEGTVAEDVNDRFDVFIRDFSILSHVIGVSLDVRDELDQKFKRESITIFSNLQKKISL